MNRTEAAKALAVASGFDRRQVDELTATAWAAALDGYHYPEVEAAIIAHHRDPATRHEYLTVAHVLDRVESINRARFADVEADVRVAKALGFIRRDWPAREPLPVEAAGRLSAHRAGVRAEEKRIEASYPWRDGELHGPLRAEQ
ncbi:hypothetical protein [Microbacterium sp. GXS0129]|uniref:hypothetical protein n=1 Tax=Microbacterium sp. GXS0129 TaxID=3377836 RepID=UPI00383B952E